MADLTIRPKRKGLTAEERETLTFKAYRLERLEAFEDGAPVTRPVAQARNADGQQVYTTAPTVAHLSAAVGIASSSLRTYESGAASPRWEIGPMVEFAQALGLTVEELNCLVQNSAREGAAAKVAALKTKAA